MPISNERKREIIDCVQMAADEIRKETELEFNWQGHHKANRSGNHGKKYNIISTTIKNKKNNATYLAQTGCFDNIEERNLVLLEFDKHSKRYHNKAKGINHINR